MEKVRDGVDGIVVDYECVTVELGLDKDGDPVTTCKVVLGESKQAEPKRKHPTKARQMFLKAMEQVRGLPAPVEKLRAEHKRLYEAAGKSEGHEKKEWCEQLKSPDICLFEQDGVEMIDQRM